MPNSQLITSPDIIESVLLINASKTQRDTVINVIARSSNSYNIYCYQTDIDDPQWLNKVIPRVQTILMDSQNPILILGNTQIYQFGPDQEMQNPVDYFNKY